MTYKLIFTPSISFFISVMIVYFFYGWYFFRFPKSPFPNSFCSNAPFTLIMIGVLSFFTEIFLALMKFNTKNIDRSLVILLENIKIAFFPIVVSIFLYLIFKFLQQVYKHENLIQKDSKSLMVKDFDNEIDTNSYSNEIIVDMDQIIKK